MSHITLSAHTKKKKRKKSYRLQKLSDALSSNNQGMLVLKTFKNSSTQHMRQTCKLCSGLKIANCRRYKATGKGQELYVA